MKKYLLLSLLLLVLISCKEDDDEDDGFSFEGTVTYYLYDSNSEVEVHNIDGLISNENEYPENFQLEFYDFENDEEYNHESFQINNNFLYLSYGGVTDTIPIVIEGDKIYTNSLEIKAKLFDITENGLEMKSYFLYHLDVEEDSQSEITQSSNFDDELKSEFETIKSNLGEGDVVGFVERTNKYGDNVMSTSPNKN